MIYLMIALAVALADRLTKVLVARLYPRGGALVSGVVNLRPVENRGVAFSMLSGQGIALMLFTAALIAGLVVWLAAHPDDPPLMRAGLWLIAGGGLGNLYDRLAFGGVSDFIELAFTRLTVFNVADICICFGAVLVLLGSLKGDIRHGK